MVQTNMVFKRYEKKYLLKGEQYSRIKKTIDPYMQMDEYGLSTICNIYYDTSCFDLVSRSMDKPVYKEKLRLRSYGIPSEDGVVFLEIKKKYDGIVYKRRIPLSLKEARKSLELEQVTGEQSESQIAKELNYFMKRYHPMPATYLAYDRIAMYGKEDENIRITFDFNIRSRQENMDLSFGDQGDTLLPKDYVIMEIKVNDAYPFWIVRMLEEMEIYPTSFSKYGTVYRERIFPNGNHGMLSFGKQKKDIRKAGEAAASGEVKREQRYMIKEGAYV